MSLKVVHRHIGSRHFQTLDFPTVWCMELWKHDMLHGFCIPCYQWHCFGLAFSREKNAATTVSKKKNNENENNDDHDHDRVNGNVTVQLVEADFDSETTMIIKMVLIIIVINWRSIFSIPSAHHSCQGIVRCTPIPTEIPYGKSLCKPEFFVSSWVLMAYW